MSDYLSEPNDDHNGHVDQSPGIQLLNRPHHVMSILAKNKDDLIIKYYSA